MKTIVRRLERGERWWAAEIAFRIVGLLLLASCAGTALWTYRSVQAHPPAGLEALAAAFAYLSWSLGWASLVEGPALFELIEVPPSHRRFSNI